MGFFKTIRQVPLSALEAGANFVIKHPVYSSLGAAAGLGLGASAMFPSPTSTPAQILTATEMDKNLLLDDLARSGKFSGEEMLALSKLSQDEIISYLSDSNRGSNPLAGLLGASAGIGAVMMSRPHAWSFVENQMAAREAAATAARKPAMGA